LRAAPRLFSPGRCAAEGAVGWPVTRLFVRWGGAFGEPSAPGCPGLPARHSTTDLDEGSEELSAFGLGQRCDGVGDGPVNGWQVLIDGSLSLVGEHAASQRTHPSPQTRLPLTTHRLRVIVAVDLVRGRDGPARGVRDGRDLPKGSCLLDDLVARRRLAIGWR
jgi:hypothetical protein